MKVLLVDSNAAAAAATVAALRAPGLEVSVAGDESGAVAAALRGPLQAVALAARGDTDGALRLVKQLRGLPRGSELFVLWLAAEAREDVLLRAYEAGIDGDATLSSSAALLAARLKAAGRLVELKARGATAPKAVAASAPAPVSAPAVVASPLERVARSTAWLKGPDALQSAAARFLAIGVSTTAVAAPAAGFARAARITLSSVPLQLELAVSLGADAKSAGELAVAVLGPGNEELADDVLSELSNIFMGALKAKFGEESLAFTGGLPQPLSTDEVLRPAVPFAQQASFNLVIGAAGLTVHLGLRSRANQLLGPFALREGMVLAKDVVNARGLLLLHQGMRLSLNMIERLQTNLPAKGLVEVMVP